MIFASPRASKKEKEPLIYVYTLFCPTTHLVTAFSFSIYCPNWVILNIV